jgi:ankyrin repeat protein
MDAIEKDLSKYSNQDLNTLYKYYDVDNIPLLASRIWSRANFPEGTVFEAVANNNFDDFMQFLNSPDFDPKSQTTNALLEACVLASKINGERYVEELLKKKPKLDYQDPNSQDGNTALMLAAKFSSTKSTEKTVQLLIDAGANVNKQNKLGSTALILAAYYSNTSSENTVAILINAGADLNKQNNNGLTALMLATNKSKTTSTENIVAMLIEAGANLDLQSNKKWTALQMATRHSNDNSNIAIVSMLIDAGANLDLQNSDGFSALLTAARYFDSDSSIETLSMLINAGANLDLQTNAGRTALIFAVAQAKNGNSDEPVKMLLEAGADPNIKNNAGLAAIDITTDTLLQLLLVKAGAIPNPKLIDFKIDELKIKISKHKKLLDNLELDLLSNNKNCDSMEKSMQGIEELKKCLKDIKKMIKLRPEGKKVQETSKKYIRKIEKTPSKPLVPSQVGTI